MRLFWNSRIERTIDEVLCDLWSLSVCEHWTHKGNEEWREWASERAARCDAVQITTEWNGVASAHIIDQIFRRFRSSSLQKITLSVHVRTAVPLVEYQLGTWSQCEFLWIGYRCSNKNYFTLSKSCYLCISYVSVFFFLSRFVRFSLRSRSVRIRLAIGLLLFRFFFLCCCCWLGVLWTIFCISMEKGNRIDFPNFWKCNIKMCFKGAFVCYHTTSIHWIGGSQLGFVQLTHVSRSAFDETKLHLQRRFIYVSKYLK